VAPPGAYSQLAGRGLTCPLGAHMRVRSGIQAVCRGPSGEDDVRALLFIFRIPWSDTQ